MEGSSSSFSSVVPALSAVVVSEGVVVALVFLRGLVMNDDGNWDESTTETASSLRVRKGRGE